LQIIVEQENALISWIS